MRIIFALLLVFLSPLGARAITIATGSSEGTYFKIAQDIQRLAAKEGIPVEVVATGGSFENINLLGAGKVDLAIMQLDVLRFAAEIMKRETGLDILQEAKVALNLYLEEIHVITRNPAIRSLAHLQGKKVAVGPERSGSALTAEVLLAGFELQVERVYDAPEEAIKKLSQGAIDALIFVGGAPVPAFANLDKTFRFLNLPADSGLEQLYPKKKIAGFVYAWTGETETHAVPSVIMTRNRADREYTAAVQRLVLLLLTQKEYLDANGHPKWKDSFIRSTQDAISYAPAAEAIQLYNALDSMGYRIIKK